MNLLTDIILPALLGKKTIVKFSAGDYDIRLAILGKVNAPAEFDQERMESAIKEAMHNALAQFVTEEMAKKAKTTGSALSTSQIPILKP